MLIVTKICKFLVKTFPNILKNGENIFLNLKSYKPQELQVSLDNY